MDPGWRPFTAKMIAKSDATVVPIFFEGHNSRLFQLASHLHSNLRLGLLIKEFKARVGRTRPRRHRPAHPRRRLARPQSDPKAMMDFLRKATYDLSPEPIEILSLRATSSRHNTGQSPGQSSMAVGIFDSGLGGLTVLDAVAKRLPDVPFVYYGDNAHAPYGVRTPTTSTT